VFSEPPEAVEIGKKQIGPFVSRRAAREADRHDVIGEMRARALRDFREQLAASGIFTA
jgi:hypothetical protein